MKRARRAPEADGASASIEPDPIPGETWFFRYPESFEHLRHWASAVTQSGPLRIASLGCASGAEAFSIAAALEHLAVVEIVAVDRNEQSMEIARSGRLRPFAVRGEPPVWTRMPWCIDGDTVVVRQELRASVNFVVADLLDPDLPALLGHFDAIFCRNCIIYLEPHERTELGAAIVRMLRPGGWLYLGHAEPPSTIGLDWRGGHASAFAFQSPPSGVVRAKGKTPRRAAAPHTASPVDASTPRRRGAPADARSGRATGRLRPAARPTEQLGLAEIVALADAGHANEALEAARVRHAANDRDPQLLALLGTLALAAGHVEEAERCLRAALYLDPGLEDAATQLTTIAARRASGRPSRSEDSRE